MDFEQKGLVPLLIDINEPILKAIKQMDEVRRKLLIVTENGEYSTVVSIGDIQRGLIRNQNFNAKISDVLREDVIFAKDTDSLEEVKETMISLRTEFMPIVDTDGRLKDILFWNDLFDEKRKESKGNLNLPVVIMAGGKGTRLRPITNIIPKPLIPLGEKPIVQLIIEKFVEMGADSFHISVNYKADMIENYFNNIKDRGYDMHYFTEDKPLGTAGSLHLLKDKIDRTFFVSNCDIIIEQDYNEVYEYHKKNRNELTLVAAIKQYNIPYGTLEMGQDGLLKELKEKPELTFFVNAGMYIVEPHLLADIPENEFFHITHLMEKIIARGGRVGVFPVSEQSWSDIGEWQEYRQTLQKFGQKVTW